MSLVIDQQYAGMIAPYVRNFTRKRNTFNFSCPICNDSATNLSRARGYIYPAGDRLKYKCHNCNTNITSLFGLLREVDNNLAEQYRLDSFKEDKAPKYEPVVRKASFADSISKSLIKVSNLPPHHPCKKYVVERRIPSNKHYLLYYTDDFQMFSMEVDPTIDLPMNYRKDPRLVIPLITETQEVAGYQGRALGESSAKYLTILYNEFNGKIFGLDRVDFNKKIYAFEGPLDALFIDNSIATTGGRIDSILEYESISKHNTVIVYDNEPRSKETVAKIKKAIDAGFKVCIWPESITESDVNKMIMAGMTPQHIQLTIDENTYSGLMGELHLQNWRKV